MASNRLLDAGTNDYLSEIGFNQSVSDLCIYIRAQSVAIIAVYVDNLIILTETKKW
jgi:hypothetical protein